MGINKGTMKIIILLSLLVVVEVLGDGCVSIIDEKRESTAVVVIDMQNDFCHPNGVFQSKLGIPDSCTPIVEPIKEITNVARAHGIPVYWIKADYSPGVVSTAFSRILANWPPLCADDWGREIITELKPHPADTVITKTSYNAFRNTTLAETLTAVGIDTVVVMGVATSICVESSVRGALFAGFHAVVVGNAVGDAPEETSATLQRIRMFYGSVASSEEVTQLWENGCAKAEL